MQRRRIRVVLSLLLAIVATSGRAAIMTFGPLPAFSEISSYTEDGITLFALNPPDHFHDGFNFLNGTTGAQFFGDDGTPQQLVFNGGADLFSLISLEVWDIDAGSDPITFTSSLGVIQSVDTAGTILFGAGFSDVSFVRIDIPDPASDRFIGIDDIQVSSSADVVPEPSTFAIVAGFTCCAFPFIRRRVRARA